MKFKTKVFGIQFEKENINGRIYDKDAVNEAIKSKSNFFVTKSTYSEKITIDEICAIATNPSIEDNSLYIEISMLNTPKANLLKDDLENHPETICITPVGKGVIIDGVVTDYSISYFTFSDATKCT